MKSLTITAAATLVTLGLTNAAPAQYVTYYNQPYQYAYPSAAYNYYGNPYFNSAYGPRVYSNSYLYQAPQYGYALAPQYGYNYGYPRTYSGSNYYYNSGYPNYNYRYYNYNYVR